MMARRVADQRAPAAPDVEQALAGAAPELAADHFELVVLRLREVIRPIDEIGAGVDELGVKEERIKGI